MRFASPGIVAAAAAALVVAGCDEARELEQRSDASACARCHGFPPPPPHLQVAICSGCHGATVTSDAQLIPGGPHMNGTVEVVPHPEGYPAHPVDAIDDFVSVNASAAESTCQQCHGPTYDIPWNVAPPQSPPRNLSCNSCHASLTFADWQTNCTFCHGTRTAGWTAAQLRLAAPPEAVERGVTSPADRRVGAHQKHLAGGTFSNPIACAECHAVPAGLAHIDGAAQLTWGPIATAGGAAPAWNGTTCANYCHGSTMPPATAARAIAWTTPATLDCASCHESNPTTGRHPGLGAGVTAHAGFDCRACHGGTYARDTTADKRFHVNGTVDLDPLAGWNATARSCTTSCHVNPDVARSW